jgi:hypothetical protein
LSAVLYLINSQFDLQLHIKPNLLISSCRWLTVVAHTQGVTLVVSRSKADMRHRNFWSAGHISVKRWKGHTVFGTVHVSRPAMPFRSLGDQYTGRQCPSGNSVTNTQTSVRAGNNLEPVASCVAASHQHNNYNNRDFSGFPSVPPDNFPTTTPPGAPTAPSRILSEPPTISLPAIVCSLRYWT